MRFLNIVFHSGRIKRLCLPGQHGIKMFYVEVGYLLKIYHWAVFFAYSLERFRSEYEDKKREDNILWPQAVSIYINNSS